MARVDWDSKVYFVLPADKELSRLEWLVQRAIAGGVGMIQYREKNKTTRRIIEEAERLRTMTGDSKVPLIINDRVDVALAVSADGVHVGGADMPVGIARRIMGPKAIIGATTPDDASLRVAEQEGADYAAFGPVFPSPTKVDREPIGVETVAQRLEETSLPACVIGGISVENAHELAGVDIALAAVVSAIAEADDPAEAVRQLDAALSSPKDQL